MILCSEFLTMKRRHITDPFFSLVEIYKKKTQNNSPLHLPLTLYLKTLTHGQRDKGNVELVMKQKKRLNMYSENED